MILEDRSQLLFSSAAIVDCPPLLPLPDCTGFHDQRKKISFHFLS
uniref:Uncharacterized protein n=1 Tax=Arundo donax TaxID=35708 RepID=A0A0A9AFL4_ARUDO